MSLTSEQIDLITMPQLCEMIRTTPWCVAVDDATMSIPQVVLRYRTPLYYFKVCNVTQDMFELTITGKRFIPRRAVFEMFVLPYVKPKTRSGCVSSRRLKLHIIRPSESTDERLLQRARIVVRVLSVLSAQLERLYAT